MRRIFTIACTLFPTLILLFISGGCNPGLVGPNPTVGQLNVFRYVAIGDGFTAGVTNGSLEPYGYSGLYAEGQQYAFPKLIADQFSLAQSIDFEQPILTGNGSGFLQISNMVASDCPAESPSPVISSVNPETGWKSPYTPQGIINNIGIPQLKAGHLLNDTLIQLNPFFSRINFKQGSFLSMIQDSRPGFFTLWLGTTDFLAYAMKGAEYPGSLPADTEQFSAALDQLLEAMLLHAPEAKGVIGNIPDITRFPYFRTVSYLYINRDKCKGTLLPVYITTASGIRTAAPEDLILLPAKDKIGTDYGSGESFGLTPENPIPAYWVLDESEAKMLRNLIQSYNLRIQSKITSLNASREKPAFALADIDYLTAQLAHSYTEDGLEVSTEYLSGGIFSLDGIYLTPRGNAVIANTFIRTINSFDSFGAIIPPINITDYPGVVFP
ncbi:MAG: SGNH/GDSL hydrolase family protein [Bacteroidia bacterium]|nr:SGNH/GDSL hydrolase family protein [Bacteroidia bacterium]